MIEFTYILFLFSGLIKGVQLGFGINLGIDFTLLTAFLTITTLSYSIFFKQKISWEYFKNRTLKLLPFIAFYVWCVYTLSYDSSGYLYFKETGNTFAYKKIAYFLTCYIALIIPLYYTNFNLEKFKKYFVNFSVFFGIFYLIITPASLFWQFGQTEKYERFLVVVVDSFANTYLFKNNINFNYTLFAGSNLAVAFNLAISLLLILSSKLTLKSVLLFSLCFILIFSTGGRSPIIFLVLMLLSYCIWKIFLGVKNNSIATSINTLTIRLRGIAIYKYVILFVVNISFMLIILYNPILNILYKKSVYRFVGMTHYIDDRHNLSKNNLIRNEKGELISADQLDSFIKKGGGKIDTSILMREMLIKSSFALITNDVKHFLFGYGFGTFGKVCKYALKNDDLPHNFLLEVFVETGLVGLLLLLFALFPMIKIVRSVNIFWAFTILFIILNALKSTPLVDRNMFGFFAITLFVCSSNIKTQKTT